MHQLHPPTHHPPHPRAILTPRQRPPPLQFNRIPDPQLVDEVFVFDPRGTFGGEFVEGGLERVGEAFDQVGDDEEAGAVETYVAEAKGGKGVSWMGILGGVEGLQRGWGVGGEGDEP